MDNDMLLSDKEIQDQFCKSCSETMSNDCYIRCQHSLVLVKDSLLKAQRDLTAKAVNEDWVKWGNGKCPHSGDFEVYKSECPLCWQERKKEMGL